MLIKKLILLPVDQKLLFLEAIYYAIFFRIISKCTPFKYWQKILGKTRKEIIANFDETQRPVVQMVFRAMRRSSVYLPIKENCLVDAFVVKKMLSKRNIRCTLYLGITKKDGSALKAHAWLKCGNEIITGHKGVQQFKVVNWYS